MKRVKAFLLIMCIGLFVSVGYGADAELSVDAKHGFTWRGMTLNDGMVIQPAVDVTMGNGFNVNVWGNIDIDDYDGAMDGGEFSEIDLTLTYAFELKGFDLSVGLIEYLFTHQVSEEVIDALGTTDITGALDGTREATLSISRDLIEGLTLSFNAYYDIDEVDDYYASLGLTYSKSLTDKVDLELAGSIGAIGSDMAIGGVSGMNDYSLSTTLSVAATDSLSLGATVLYVDALDTDVLPYQDVDFCGGLNITQAF